MERGFRRMSMVFAAGSLGGLANSLALTPAFVVVFNAIWGVTAAYWLKYTGKEE